MARVLWKGTLRFGLVHIPVQVVTAVKDHGIKLHLLSEDGRCRLRTRLYCPDTGREYDFSQAARGYEVAPDQFVVLDEEELEAIRPEAGKVIEIVDFVDPRDIPPVYFDRTYHLAPGERGGPGWRLLHRAMRRAGRMAIVQFVMRRKQQLAALHAADDVIYLRILHYADEVLPYERRPIRPEAEPDPRQLEVAVELIDELSRGFEPARYRDAYRDRLAALIESKIEGEAEVAPARALEHEPTPAGELTDALERSLRRARRSA